MYTLLMQTNRSSRLSSFLVGTTLLVLAMCTTGCGDRSRRPTSAHRPLPDPTPNASVNDSAAAEADSSSLVVWARRMGGSGIEEANSVEVDSAGNIFITGVSHGPLDFG